MIHEDFEGNVRRVTWGDLRDMSNRLATVLVAHGVQRGDRVAMLLPPAPETAAAFIGGAGGEPGRATAWGCSERCGTACPGHTGARP